MLRKTAACFVGTFLVLCFSVCGHSCSKRVGVSSVTGQGDRPLACTVCPQIQATTVNRRLHPHHHSLMLPASSSTHFNFCAVKSRPPPPPPPPRIFESLCWYFAPPPPPPLISSILARPSCLVQMNLKSLENKLGPPPPPSPRLLWSLCFSGVVWVKKGTRWGGGLDWWSGEPLVCCLVPTEAGD